MQEEFANFIEIQSLDLKILKHKKNLTEQDRRLELLETQRAKACSDLNCLKSKKQQLEESVGLKSTDLAKLLERLKNLQANIESAVQFELLEKMNRELLQLKEQRDALEEVILSEMEKIEKSGEEINRLECFLLGLVETQKTIAQEVSEATKTEGQEIENLNKRIEALLENSQAPKRSLLQKAREKFHFKDYLSFIQQGKCSRCLFLLDRQTAQQIERAETLENCPSCSRLIVTNGHFY